MCFLLQCSLYVNQQPSLYPTDTGRISFVCSLLTGKALDWATAVWRDDSSVFPTFAEFLQRFREVFEHPAGGQSQNCSPSHKVKPQQLNITTHALLDSGAAGNFMSDTFIKEYNISLTDCYSPLTVEALDGKPIGGGKVAHITDELQLQVGILHHETIRFYVIHSPNNPIILGLPWLRTHNPHVSWKDGQILQWDALCHKNCLQHVIPLPPQAVEMHESNPGKLNIPAEFGRGI